MAATSVVIVTYQSAGAIAACLEGLLRHAPPGTEVIVVDNASKDGSADLVEARFPTVKVLRRASNGGFAVGANAGMRAASGDLVCLMNPDTEVSEDFISPVREFLAGRPDVGILGPKIYNPSGTVQLSCRRFPDHRVAVFNRYSLMTRLRPRNRLTSHYLMSDWDHAETREVDWVSGACMFLTRELRGRVGLFDERFFFKIEDVDLCRRAWDSGFRVVYFPAVSLVHQIGGSSKHARYRLVLAHHRGMWVYYRKHLARNRLVDAATLAGIVVRGGFCFADAAIRSLPGRWRQVVKPA